MVGDVVDGEGLSGRLVKGDGLILGSVERVPVYSGIVGGLGYGGGIPSLALGDGSIAIGDLV